MKTRLSAIDLLLVVAVVLFANLLFAVTSPVVQARAQEARISSSAAGPMKADERVALTYGKMIVVVDYQGKVIRREDF
jgi:hypothetical protein